MKRFTKAAAIRELEDRAETYHKQFNFDPRNGTSQFWPPGADKATKNAIYQAVAYGRWLAYSDIACDIESGELGTGAAP